MVCTYCKRLVGENGARGMCYLHYRLWRRGFTLKRILRYREVHGKRTLVKKAILSIGTMSHEQLEAVLVEFDLKTYAQKWHEAAKRMLNLE